MRVNAIIAEYNPFHNGHLYQLEESKRRTGADYTMIVMSGNFVQRGAPALLHKYARAEMALNCGADLVLELPSFYACGSAEYFASGAVALIDRLGVADYLCFGSEQGDISALQRIAHLLAEEPEDYKQLLSCHLTKGHSFPTARTKALAEAFQPAASAEAPYDPYAPSINDERALTLPQEKALALPNNILGIEYLKALHSRKSAITPFTIARIGAEYHEDVLTGQAVYPSARSLRRQLFASGSAAALKDHMPQDAFRILSAHLAHTPPVAANDFSQMLLYKLLSEEAKGYSEYLDVSPDLSDKIRNALDQYTDYDSFCTLLKSKDLTYTRISRCLLHILLDIREAELQHYRALDRTPYARVLGLNKNASPLLSAIKAHSDIPLLTKLADARKLLSEDAFAMLKREIQINRFYYAAEAAKSKICMRNEYRMQIPVI